MAEIRKHCFDKIKDVFDKYDWNITGIDYKLHSTIFDMDLMERMRILKILSPEWKLEIVKMPETMEKSIYNTSIKEARIKQIER